jgi:radical SAM superfamily enzyme YgiQ (UPF0313 family)
MDYVGHVIRPPSEAASIILQVTVGCSHNRCTFCGAYKDVKFRIKDPVQIVSDLKYAAAHFPSSRKLFLADGDVLVLSQNRLLDLLAKIREYLPTVKRVRLYGNAKSILAKNTAQLAELKKHGVDRIYMGLESGHDPILKEIRKWGTSSDMIRAARIVNDASIFLSVTLLLGIGGTTNSRAHAQATAEVLNQMNPNQIAALTLMLVPGTPLFKKSEQGQFCLPSSNIMLEELRTIVDGIDLPKTQFQANHASNFLPVNCRLKRDKQKVLHDIDMALAGNRPLVPDYMRGL